MSCVTDKLHRVLATEMSRATEVTMCVAFLKTSGLQLIEKDLEAVLKRGGCVTVVAGLDFYITEPAVLHTLLGMFKKYHDKGTLYLMEQGNNTYHPKRYAVLNKNPVESLKGMGLPEFPSPQIFSPEKYGEFVDLLKEVVDICGLKDLSHADHFCNYVYWDIKNHKESK